MNQATRVQRPRYQVLIVQLTKLLGMASRQAREIAARNYKDERFVRIADECQRLADQADSFSSQP